MGEDLKDDDVTVGNSIKEARKILINNITLVTLTSNFI